MGTTVIADRCDMKLSPTQGMRNFVSSCVTVLRDGLDRDERLIFLASQRKIEAVRDALGDDVEDIALVPTDEHGRNPSRIMTLLDSFQATHAAGDERRALGVNETVLAGRSAAALAEAQLAEGVLNDVAVQGWPLSLVCLYDTDSLDPDSLSGMRRSHPVIRGEADDNPDYDEGLVAVLYAAELPPPATYDLATHHVVETQLSQARTFVRSVATNHDVAPDRVDDLVLAANEIVTNSLRHAGGRCTVTMWLDHDTTYCQVEDSGYLRNPLLGRLVPTPASPSGRGLWLANHLCDLVQIRSSPSRTVVRLGVDRAAAPGS